MTPVRGTGRNALGARSTGGSVIARRTLAQAPHFRRVCPRLPLCALRQGERRYGPEIPRARTAVARTIGFARALEPQESITRRHAGLGGGANTERAAFGIAPGVIFGRPIAVAAGIDHEMRAAGQRGERFAVR